MVVCHCLHINDRVIDALDVDPDATVDDVTAACGAGGRCGGCRDTIALLLRRARATAATPVVATTVAGTPVTVTPVTATPVTVTPVTVEPASLGSVA